MSASTAVGSRLAVSLRKVEPRNTAKIVSLKTGAAVATVKGWLQGKPPGLEHLAALSRVYGRAFGRHVLEPVFDQEQAAAPDLASEIAELRAGLALVEARLRGEGH